MMALVHDLDLTDIKSDSSGYTLEQPITPEARRTAILQLDPDILIELVKTGRTPFAISVENGIPEDGRVLAVVFDSMSRVWNLLVESKSYAPIDVESPYEGFGLQRGRPPLLDPIEITKHFLPQEE